MSSSHWDGLSYTQTNSGKINSLTAVLKNATRIIKLQIWDYTCTSIDLVGITYLVEQNVIEWSISARDRLLVAMLCKSYSHNSGMHTCFREIDIHQGTCKQYKSAPAVRDKIPSFG